MNFEQILKYTRAYVLVVDRSMNVVYSNRETAPSLINYPAITHAISTALREKESFNTMETRMVVPKLTDPEKGEIDVWVKGEYMVMDNREYVELTIIDITSIKEERKNFDDAISEAKKEAMGKSSYLANMSHEIRTPLNAILGFSKLLMESDDPSKNAKYCEIIETNTHLLQQLINDVLDISKIETGTLKYQYETVDINELIETIDSTVRIRVQPNTILNHVLGMAECKIVTDPDRISQVLINLLTNACKFTPKGSITFGYEEQDENIYFFVKDTGIGIPADKQPLLFQRFSTQNDDKHSTGLGLSICKNIIETMHGEIGMKSGGEGKGSLFWFTIPIVRPGETPVETPSEEVHSPLVGNGVVDSSSSDGEADTFTASHPQDTPSSFRAPYVPSESHEPAQPTAPVPSSPQTEPTPAPAPAPAPIEQPQAQPPKPDRITVLVAEDNESNYLLFESILEDDFNLIHAWNGREAIEMYAEHHPDIILMDISMPFMDGYEATRNIRKSGSDVPIIAVTAYAFSSDKERIMENGFNSYVSKPVNADRLISEMERCLKTSK